MVPCTMAATCLDRLTVAERVLSRTAADDFAHGAFGDLLLQRLGRFLDVEEIGLRVRREEHRELDVEDVLVARQHQAVRRRRGRRADILLLDRDLTISHRLHSYDEVQAARRLPAFRATERSSTPRSSGWTM